MSRRWLSSVVVVSLVFLLAAACGSDPPAKPPASTGTAFTKSVPADIADLPLTDDQGRTTTLASFGGRYVMLTDFLTLCQDVCPLTSTNFAAIDRAITKAGLEGNVQLVELTVDPERDTPQRLAAYRQIFHAPQNWSLLTASPDTIAKIWKYFGAYYQRTPEDSDPGTDWLTGQPLTYDVDHSDVLAYLDPQGRERFLIFGLPNTQGKPIPPAMAKFLSDLGRTHQLHPAADTWTTAQALSALSWLTGKEIHPSA